MKVKTEVYTSIDLFKFIAAALIVCIHTRPFYAYPMLDLFWTRVICQIAVPFFFCFSSYIFFKRGKSIRDYIKRMLSLYLVWFIIEIPFVYLRFFHHQELFPATKDFIVGLLFHNTFFASWFITASCQAMLIVWLLAKRSSKVLYITGVASFGLFAFLVSGGGKNWPLLSKIIELPSFIQALPYVTLGHFMATHKLHKIPLWRGQLWLLCLIVLGILEMHFLLPSSNIAILPLIFVLVSLLLDNNMFDNTPFVSLCRKSSILIYLLHGVIKQVFVIVTGIGYGLIMFIVTWSLSVLMAYIIIKGSEKYSLLHRLY